IEWHEGDAQRLRFRDGAFDVVLSAQVLQYVEDRIGALAHMRRVLKPGGIVAFSSWRAIDENPYIRAIVAALATHFRADAADRSASACSLADGHVIRALVVGAGFEAPVIRTEELTLRLAAPEEFVGRHMSATAMAETFAAAPQEVRAAFVRDVAARLAPYAA